MKTHSRERCWKRPASVVGGRVAESATAAAWKTKPSWFVVSERDNASRPTGSDSSPNGWRHRPGLSPDPTLRSSHSRSQLPNFIGEALSAT